MRVVNLSIVQARALPTQLSRLSPLPFGLRKSLAWGLRDLLPSRQFLAGWANGFTHLRQYHMFNKTHSKRARASKANIFRTLSLLFLSFFCFFVLHIVQFSMALISFFMKWVPTFTNQSAKELVWMAAHIWQLVRSAYSIASCEKSAHGVS